MSSTGLKDGLIICKNQYFCRLAVNNLKVKGMITLKNKIFRKTFNDYRICVINYTEYKVNLNKKMSLVHRPDGKIV